MARFDSQILELNPWWRDAGAITRDPHISRLDSAPFRWHPPALEAIPLAPGSTHTLRGPRQVGKTTTAKQLIERLLDRGERRVLYFSFDLQKNSQAIRDVIVRAKQLHPDPHGPWYLFLDEVTSIPEWQMGLKYLYDQGSTLGDLILCTGSSARKMGAEQLPGRRGNGRDFVQLPMSFRAFCKEALGISIPDETIGMADVLTPSGARLIRELNLRASELNDAVAHYLKTGGFPAAVGDSLAVPDAHRPDGGEVRDITIRMLWDIIASDVQNARHDKHSALRLLERVGVSLGTPVAWDSLRRDMDVGSHNTAKAYTHLLSEAFVLMTVFSWSASGGFEPERQRKLYFIDPLLARIAPTLVAGARGASRDGLVENLVAIALYRAAAEDLVLADPLPGGIGYWKSSNQRETDFIAPARTVGGSDGRVAVEVKGDALSNVAAARHSLQRTFGRGIVVTRTILEWRDDVPAIPLAVFLASLGDRPQRPAAGL